jgi:hypothetical protein
MLGVNELRGATTIGGGGGGSGQGEVLEGIKRGE